MGTKWLIPAFVFLLPVVTFFSGCGGNLVKVNLIDEKSALESQVLGTYQEIDQDIMLLASVRSVDRYGKLKEAPPMSDKRKKTIRAMQRRAFNRDDLEVFKQGVVGENLHGLLSIFADNANKLPPKQRRFLEEIVSEENEDRKTIMLRIIEVNENFSEKDISKIEKTFARLNRDNAKPGEWIQGENGKWKKK